MLIEDLEEKLADHEIGKLGHDVAIERLQRTFRNTDQAVLELVWLLATCKLELKNLVDCAFAKEILNNLFYASKDDRPGLRLRIIGKLLDCDVHNFQHEALHYNDEIFLSYIESGDMYNFTVMELGGTFYIMDGETAICALESFI